MNFRWITLISFTIVAILVWIVVGLTRDNTGEHLQETYRAYLTPLSAEINEDALVGILKREEETVLIDRDVLK